MMEARLEATDFRGRRRTAGHASFYEPHANAPNPHPCDKLMAPLALPRPRTPQFSILIPAS
ncbi:hypothetical protein X777_06306 [Ooceraea biroi]|uniref:Uncharacterized protein n=1 Tax=Ooceraea biroi TaxID=2015173 RepID=A0A026WAV1_OOCBI|nr:hypothetical protein X777_06306 [Ooceraea biroi]